MFGIRFADATAPTRPGLALIALAPERRQPAAAGRCGDPSTRPWCDTSLSPDERAGLLLAQMTAEEKISLLGGDERCGVAGGAGTHTGTSDGIERLGIPTIYFSDGPAGVALGHGHGDAVADRARGELRPRNSARDAGVIADEVIKKGNDIVFAPTVDIVRTPLAGRVFEALGGEDPYLSTELAVPWIETVQDAGLIANVKHYMGNNQEGTGPRGQRGAPRQLRGLARRAGDRGQPDADRRPDRRADHARALPADVRGGGQEGERGLGDVRVQPDQRPLSPARASRCSRTSSAATGASRA